MDNFQSIEDKLSQLIPSSVSEEGQMKMEDTIDELVDSSFDLAEIATVQDATQDSLRQASTGTSLSSWPWKAAAAIALLAVPAVMFEWKSSLFDSVPPSSLAVIDPVSEVFGSSQLVVLKTTNRVDGLEDDGLILPLDGSAPHYRYRYHVIDEERVLDEKTGIVITLRQPRQEVVTVPVTQF